MTPKSVLKILALREVKNETTIPKIISSLRNKNYIFRESELRQVIWSLIDDGTLTFTKERTIR